MNLIRKLFAKDDDRAFVRPLYAAIVAQARMPHWYDQGEVADSIDGRFDMVSAILALVLIRIEALGREAAPTAVLLTEIFVEDMDGQLRELGIGDVVVGKHIGKMMSALGGRLGAYRACFVGAAPLAEALLRNLYRGIEPAPGALAHVEAGLHTLHAGLANRPLDHLLAGRIAAP